MRYATRYATEPPVGQFSSLLRRRHAPASVKSSHRRCAGPRPDVVGVGRRNDRRNAVRDRSRRIARHSRENTIEMLPTTIDGQKIKWIVLDDGSDTTRAVTNTRKLISEDNVDVIVGSTITPNSLAMIDIVAEAQTPMVSMAASARIVDPVESEDALGLQDAAERLPDGGCDRRAYESERRQDDRLHRLQRRLRRELVRRDTACGAGRRDYRRRRREIQPQRRVGHRTGAEARGRAIPMRC